MAKTYQIGKIHYIEASNGTRWVQSDSGRYVTWVAGSRYELEEISVLDDVHWYLRGIGAAPAALPSWAVKTLLDAVDEAMDQIVKHGG